MKKYNADRRNKGIKQRPLKPSAKQITDRELHELFSKLAELVDTVAESRHIETMEAYSIINSIINHYQL